MAGYCRCGACGPSQLPAATAVWLGSLKRPEMVGELQGQKNTDVPGHQPAGAALSFQLRLPAPALPPSPTVKTEVRWEHLKRLTEIFPKVYSNCGESIIRGGGGGTHKGTTQEQKLLNRPDLPRAPDLTPIPHSQPTWARSSSHQTSPCSRSWPLIPGTLRTPAQNVLLCGLSYSQNDWQWKYPPRQGKTQSPHKGFL